MFVEKTTILLVDDHRLLRESSTAILNSDDRFLVIGDTGNGIEAIRMVKVLKPAIVLLDINMDPVDGFEVARQICDMESSSGIIGLSIYNSIPAVKRFLALGARGYLTKGSSYKEMIKAILEVNNGNQYVCEEVRYSLSRRDPEADSPVQLLKSLSARELEVVHKVKLGLPSREIALLLNINLGTVEAHRHHILKKLKLKNTAAVINFLNKNGI